MTNKGAVILGAVAVGTALVFIMVKGAKAAPPPEGYCCPYCAPVLPMCFDTYEELVAHVQSAHPRERIPLEIEWS